MELSSNRLRLALKAWVDLSMRSHFRTVAEFAKERGLSFSRMGTLVRLKKSGECSVSELAKHLDVSSAAASQLVEKLCSDGLISAVESPDDRRSRRIGLTEEGRLLLSELEARHEHWLFSLESELSEKERLLVADALETLLAKSRSREDAPDGAGPLHRGDGRKR
jgi:DNA-binding MarR family transcriptional regulator